MVLAACDAGAEHRYAGGEVLGFVSALMARGTAGVITGASMAQALWRARTDAGLEQAAGYVAWSGVTAYGAA